MGQPPPGLFRGVRMRKTVTKVTPYVHVIGVVNKGLRIALPPGPDFTCPAVQFHVSSSRSLDQTPSILLKFLINLQDFVKDETGKTVRKKTGNFS
jgi:hypothetical protein